MFKLGATSRYYVHLVRYKGGLMPRRPRPLSPDDGPLAVFALELRAMRDRHGPTAPTPDDIATREGIHRTTVYAALSGKRVPSRDVLAAIVKQWNGDQVEWAAKRTALENVLSTARQLLEKPIRPGETRAGASSGVTWDELQHAGVTWQNPRGSNDTLSASDGGIERAIFIRDLGALIIENQYSYQVINSRSGVSMGTLSSIVNSRALRLPRWEIVERILRAIYINETDIKEWQMRWIRVRGQQ
ncbi:helix-turn-helix transcriptional regulator [Amycolatopsis sp. WAC 04182]|uniref:helix-turn-helix domain-containing protein n=1 Tax=Amycolatopsis sp. WAC 04182 TaxID=2203198 RepID=UPI000F7B8824|nr:helix-turn-helix transcriptional regulator [Amycolatopsis sp. WAC 04182]